jgi:hypothetical protein
MKALADILIMSISCSSWKICLTITNMNICTVSTFGESYKTVVLPTSENVGKFHFDAGTQTSTLKHEPLQSDLPISAVHNKFTAQ